jgi:hypothetical protein
MPNTTMCTDEVKQRAVHIAFNVFRRRWTVQPKQKGTKALIKRNVAKIFRARSPQNMLEIIVLWCVAASSATNYKRTRTWGLPLKSKHYYLCATKLPNLLYILRILFYRKMEFGIVETESPAVKFLQTSFFRSPALLRTICIALYK